MKFTLSVVAVLTCWTKQAEGIVQQSHRGSEIINRYNRGVQTFESGAESTDSIELNQEMATTLKPLPSTYTVVDWQRYYPFGDKLAETNGTESEAKAATTSPDVTKQEQQQQIRENIVYPVYIKVPIRVPLKSPFRKPEQSKIARQRAVRGAKNLGHPYRYKIPPRFMMVRHQMPIRRKFVSYYPSYVYKRHPQYIKPVYLRTGIHDYYQKNVYYPLRDQGYAVTEPKVVDWYDSAKAKPSGNFV